MANKKITDVVEATSFDHFFVNDGGAIKQILKDNVLGTRSDRYKTAQSYNQASTTAAKNLNLSLTKGVWLVFATGYATGGSVTLRTASSSAQSVKSSGANTIVNLTRIVDIGADGTSVSTSFVSSAASGTTTVQMYAIKLL